MKAVIWTDTFQAICMFGSFMGIIIYGSQVVGGPAKVFDINYQAGRVELFNFDPVRDIISWLASSHHICHGRT